MSGILSRAGHVKSCLNPPEPSGKAKYVKRPIVYKYCEGKVKRTSNRGVKENLKPSAYKRSERK